MIHNFLLCNTILLLHLAIKYLVDLALLSKLKYCNILGFVPKYYSSRNVSKINRMFLALTFFDKVIYAFPFLCSEDNCTYLEEIKVRNLFSLFEPSYNFSPSQFLVVFYFYNVSSCVF